MTPTLNPLIARKSEVVFRLFTHEMGHSTRFFVITSGCILPELKMRRAQIATIIILTPVTALSVVPLVAWITAVYGACFDFVAKLDGDYCSVTLQVDS